MTPSAYKIYMCASGYFSGTLFCISQCLYFCLFHSWTSQFRCSFFKLLDSFFLCLQLKWASFGNKVNPPGKSLWKCCKGQGLGWRHTYMKRFVLSELVWADTNRSYNIPPPGEQEDTGNRNLPSSVFATYKTWVIVHPCSLELRPMAMLAFPCCCIKDLGTIIWFCPSHIFCQ